MRLNECTHKFLLILLTSILAFSSVGAVEYYQSNKINNNGSISIYIVYSAPNQQIKQNNDLVGSLPFAQNLANTYFTFPGAEVKSVGIYKDPLDSANRTKVAVDLVVTDFSKISESKAFKDIKATWVKTDTGAVYIWSMSPADLRKNLIETYHFALVSDPEIKSTNGNVSGKDVSWYVYGNTDNTYGAYFVATVKADDMNIVTSQENSNKTKDPKDKSCGLFGLELPIVLLFGLFLNLKLRRGRI